MSAPEIETAMMIGLLFVGVIVLANRIKEVEQRLTRFEKLFMPVTKEDHARRKME